ncbi:hypothetical protein PV403_22010 [Paenibacillus sp. GYB006]|uniref:hypothetical protein n=2 Tax=unclassified Paenibacillus TaxID=185978 RepID=UPI002F96B3F0
MNELQIKDVIDAELKRMAWRLQYHAKKAARQYPFTYDFTRQESFEDEIVDELHVKDMLNMIDKGNGKKVVYSLYVEEKSAKEVSAEMNMTVQAVNKWKRQTLEDLKKKVSHNYSSKQDPVKTKLS